MIQIIHTDISISVLCIKSLSRWERLKLYHTEMQTSGVLFLKFLNNQFLGFCWFCDLLRARSVHECYVQGHALDRGDCQSKVPFFNKRKKIMP